MVWVLIPIFAALLAYYVNKNNAQRSRGGLYVIVAIAVLFPELYLLQAGVRCIGTEIPYRLPTTGDHWR